MDQKIDTSPHFNLRPFAMNDELLGEILNNLNEKNDKRCSEKAKDNDEFLV
jgi:hypothetical protein